MVRCLCLLGVRLAGLNQLILSPQPQRLQSFAKLLRHKQPLEPLADLKPLLHKRALMLLTLSMPQQVRRTAAQSLRQRLAQPRRKALPAPPVLPSTAAKTKTMQPGRARAIQVQLACLTVSCTLRASGSPLRALGGRPGPRLVRSLGCTRALRSYAWVCS